MRFARWTLLSLLVVLPAGAAGTDPEDVEAIKLPLSKEISYFTFMEQAGRVRVWVNGQFAGLEKAEEYVAFQIIVAVSGEGPELAVDRQHFELHDAYGQVHETVDPDKIRENGMVQFVKPWVAQNPLQTGNALMGSAHVASNFYATTAGGLTRANLDRETYMTDVIYFPAPKDLHGELMLSFFSKGMKEGPVNVRFKVPVKKKKKD